MIVSDNGTEFTSNAISVWWMATSHPASRCRMVFVVSFNGRLRDEWSLYGGIWGLRCPFWSQWPTVVRQTSMELQNRLTKAAAHWNAI